MADIAIPWLDDTMPLPATRAALGPASEAPGLLAAGGELNVQRLQEAYRKGVFPWYAPGQPVLWWSPDPRMVLWVDEFKLSRSLRKTISRFVRTPGCEVRIDSAFEQVIAACSQSLRAGQAGTWIVPEVIDAYGAWHRAGAVHSFETWVDGRLVGGLYGVGVGRMFFGESMFSHRTDASKIALAALVAFCRGHDIALVDCQQSTGHLASLGAREITRSAFERHLSVSVAASPVSRWTFDPTLWSRIGLGTEAAP